MSPEGNPLSRFNEGFASRSQHTITSTNTGQRRMDSSMKAANVSACAGQMGAAPYRGFDRKLKA